jgi:hypothetical protein
MPNFLTWKRDVDVNEWVLDAIMVASEVKSTNNLLCFPRLLTQSVSYKTRHSRVQSLLKEESGGELLDRKPL